MIVPQLDAPPGDPDSAQPPSRNRKLGQFSTPSVVAELLASWTICDSNDFVLDPCAGSGALVLQAISRLVEVGCTREKALGQVYAIDIDPGAISHLEKTTPLNHAFVADFLSTDLTTLASSNSGPRNGFDAIICNPPYTRHHLLGGGYKERIARHSQRIVSDTLSRNASLYVHFLIQASRFLATEGRMAFLTPSSFLDADYGLPIKKFLLENFAIRAIIILSENIFERQGVETSSCISLLETGSMPSEVAFVDLPSSQGTKGLLSALGDRREINQFQGRNIRRIPQPSLDVSSKWSRLASSSFSGPKHRFDRKDLVPLSSLANVHRGVATGANNFFVLSASDARRLRIERRFLSPLLRKLRWVRGLRFDKPSFRVLNESGRKVWLLTCPSNTRALTRTRLLKYLKEGERAGFDKRFLATQRIPWYSLDRLEPPPIVFSYMNRGTPRFIYNTSGAIVLNNLLGLYPIRGIAGHTRRLKALTYLLNGNEMRSSINSASRWYGLGLLKVEPGDLGQIMVPDVRGMTEQEVSELAQRFDALQSALTEE